MTTRFFLSVLCAFLLASNAYPQAATSDSNLYHKALSVCVEKQSQEYKNLGGEHDYLNRIVEKNIFLTDKLPTQIGEYRVKYLDGDGLIARYKQIRKPFLILSMRPMMNDGSMLKISLADYWIRYEKLTLSFGLEGGCNVFFRYDCEQKTYAIDKIDLWGI